MDNQTSKLDDVATIPGISDDKIAPLTDLFRQVQKTLGIFNKDYVEKEDILPMDVRKKIIINVDMPSLTTAIGHARVDIIRWAAFHLSGDKNSRPDRHKYAGFLSKWIAKTRPINIQVADDSTLEPLAEFYKINAILAFFVFRSYLHIKKEHNVPELKKMEKELIYRFHLRDETGENLAFMAYCYEIVANLPDAPILTENISDDNKT